MKARHDNVLKCLEVNIQVPGFLHRSCTQLFTVTALQANITRTRDQTVTVCYKLRHKTK